MAIIAVDIDSTLYDFYSEAREAFFELANKYKDKTYLRGAYSSDMEWRVLTDVMGLDTALEVIAWVHDRQYDQRPYKDSARVLRRLAKEHTIKYVGARQHKYYDITKLWLSRCFFPQGELICSGSDKASELSDCQYLIDDRPLTIIKFLNQYEAQMGHRKAFGLWTNYNRNLTDIKNIYLAPTWRGLEYYLEAKSVLSK